MQNGVLTEVELTTDVNKFLRCVIFEQFWSTIREICALPKSNLSPRALAVNRAIHKNGSFVNHPSPVEHHLLCAQISNQCEWGWIWTSGKRWYAACGGTGWRDCGSSDHVILFAKRARDAKRHGGRNSGTGSCSQVWLPQDDFRGQSGNGQ